MPILALLVLVVAASLRWSGADAEPPAPDGPRRDVDAPASASRPAGGTGARVDAEPPSQPMPLGESARPAPADTRDATAAATTGRVVVTLSTTAAAGRDDVGDARLVLRRLPDGRGERLRPVDGVATAEDVAPGSYVVELSGRGLARGARTLEVAAGRTTTVALALAPGLPLVVVLAHDGDLIAEAARVTLEDDAGSLLLDATLRRPFLAVQSEAELPVWLAEGRYTLRVEAPPSAAQQRTLEVRAGQPLRERFTLE